VSGTMELWRTPFRCGALLMTWWRES